MIIYEGKEPYKDELESTAYNGKSYSPITLALSIVFMVGVLVYLGGEYLYKKIKA